MIAKIDDGCTHDKLCREQEIISLDQKEVNSGELHFCTKTRSVPDKSFSAALAEQTTCYLGALELMSSIGLECNRAFLCFQMLLQT